MNFKNKKLSQKHAENYLENTQKQAKVKEYEQQIDKMVYELYNLTHDEVTIVEEGNYN